MLADKIRFYEDTGKMPRNTPVAYKAEYPWLKEVDSLALCHEKIRNQRHDFQNKLSCRLAETYDAIIVEDLDMKAMSRCLHLGKGVMDKANGRFQRILRDK